ncbi:MAG: apolipoprotein N-acyltransferase, partial [Pseudomonadota bacterium]
MITTWPCSKGLVRFVLAPFLVGALTVLSFAPFEFAWLPILTLSFLLFTWLSATTQQSFYSGLFFGLGLFLFGVSWVYNSLSVYGGMPFWMGSIAVLGFSSLLSLFIATCGLLLAWLTPSKPTRLVLFPFTWIVFEWAKSWVLTGFPWLDIGYTQTETMLFSYAPLGGVYLVSFTVACLAAALVFVLINWRIGSPHRFLFIPIGLAISLFSVAYIVSSSTWSQPVGQPLSIGIVQPNTPITQKWGIAYRDKVIAGLISNNQQLLNKEKLDLIVWPETALPVYLSQTSPQFWDAVRPSGVALLTGLIEERRSGGLSETYNAAVLVCEQGQSVYRKRHLVPFGEYLPLRFLFQWVLDYLEFPMSDMTAWQGEQSLSCGDGIKLGLSICYEDAFAGEYQQHVGDATVLVNISEDAWFGESLAASQRLQMARMRARELSLPLVRSGNTGPSAFIDSRGEVIAVSAQFE